SISHIRMTGDLSAYGAILIDKRSNVSIHHCIIEDFYTRGVTFSGAGYYNDVVPDVYARGNSFHDNVLRNCADYAGGGQYGSGYGNLEIGGQEGMLVYNNSIIQEDRGTDANGFCIKYANDGYCRGLKIYNNTITKPPYDGSTWDFSMELWNCRGGIEIYGNNVQGSIDFGGNTSITNDAAGYGFAIKIYNNIIGQDQLRSLEENGVDLERGHTGGIYIYNNIFRNLTSALVMYQGNGDVFEDMYVYYNIFTNMGASGRLNYGNGIDWQTIDVSNITYDNINFINNTISAGTEGDAQSGLRFNFRGNATNIRIINNIITGFNASPVYFESYFDVTNLSIENNLFFDNGNWNQPMYSNVTPINNTTANNITDNPLFESQTDFHIQEHSPAIGSGMYISWLSSDLDGNTVKDTPSIGAYEYYPPEPPVFQDASVEDNAPSILLINYNLNLAGIVPSASSFSVNINSSEEKVNSVSVTGKTVELELENEIICGDVVTFSYTPPADNQLQSTRGIAAVSVASATVSNNCLPKDLKEGPPVINVIYPETVYGGFVAILDASSSYDPNNQALTATWKTSPDIPVSDSTGLIIKFLAPVVTKSVTLSLTITVDNGTAKASQEINIDVIPYHPELYKAKITDTEASNFIIPNVPSRATDGDTSSYWKSDGTNQWLQVKFSEPSPIRYIKLNFPKDQKYTSYFDLYGSSDRITWNPLLLNMSSCGFSGQSQIFAVPSEFSGNKYLYLMYVGQGNSINTMNIISEFQAFGPDNPNGLKAGDPEIKIYPNPSTDHINILILNPEIIPDQIIITDMTGKKRIDKSIEVIDNYLQLQLDLNPGMYVVELLADNLILTTQKILVVSAK
ncbi:MAG TPA: SwmB domain-containing protein, partial [Bacteroidales bacterium]|nr:SwmB domain-containing protein [Bacteroidales bacterium]